MLKASFSVVDQMISGESFFSINVAVDITERFVVFGWRLNSEILKLNRWIQLNGEKLKIYEIKARKGNKKN